eukprot:TRINITY_DN51294_c0_g1_i1.p1 TRINITY_DN51294_c0_g1~~TRINITY_DN51294_c0_g1_i1.p1  ORF type:complete len:637 (+),score=144.18 TRINITY_DN51294_c0_g1_i1:111-1913(+)
MGERAQGWWHGGSAAAERPPLPSPQMAPAGDPQPPQSPEEPPSGSACGDGGDEDDGWATAAAHRSKPTTPRPGSGKYCSETLGSATCCSDDARAWPLPPAPMPSGRRCSSAHSGPVSPQSPWEGFAKRGEPQDGEIALRLVRCVLGSLTLPDWAASEQAAWDDDDDGAQASGGWRREEASYAVQRRRCSSDGELAVESVAAAAFARSFATCGVGSVSEFRRDWEQSVDPVPEPTRGKSPSVFVASPSRRFLLKTIRHEEARAARRLLPSYFEHLAGSGKSGQPPCLLVPCLGLHYAVAGDWRQPFVVMASVMPSPTGGYRHLLPCVAVFDFKGSTLRRRAGHKEQQMEQPVLKDGDFLEWGGALPLPTAQRELLCDALRRDLKWLEQSNVMDYSLLLCKCEAPAAAPLPRTRPGLLVLVAPGAGLSGHHNAIYLCGLIDYWQDYNIRKRLEASVRQQMVHLEASLGGERQQPSCVPPAEYASRLLEFTTGCFREPEAEAERAWTWRDQRALEQLRRRPASEYSAADRELFARYDAYLKQGVDRLKAEAPRRGRKRRAAAITIPFVALSVWTWGWAVAAWLWSWSVCFLCCLRRRKKQHAD